VRVVSSTWLPPGRRADGDDLLFEQGATPFDAVPAAIVPGDHEATVALDAQVPPALGEGVDRHLAHVVQGWP
jgi:hypothetical protein